MIEKERGQLPSQPLNAQHKGNKKLPYRKSSAVKQLELLANEAARTKYPNVPYLAPRIFRDDTANGLTKCILAFLRIKGRQAERINSTGRFIDDRKKFEDVLGHTRVVGSASWVKGTGSRGTADISATILGRSVKIEVKVGADRQSQFQKDYQVEVEKSGGIYFIARTFEEFYGWYNSNFREGCHECCR